MKSRRNKLFGTDGIRGRSGDFPLDEAGLARLGRVLAEVLGPVSILIGRDTRESSVQIEQKLLAGMSSGQTAFLAGVIPTPGLSFSLGHGAFDYGIMITASHNPYHDNGIKLFSGAGEKIPDDLQQEIEARFFSLSQNRAAFAGCRTEPYPAADEYAAVLKKWGRDASGSALKMVIDCANGAASFIAPQLFSELGFNHKAIHCSPSGRNINDRCGATSLEALAAEVRCSHADLGLAFDGDGDRVLFVDSAGETISGDHVLYVLAKLQLQTEPGWNRKVVGTIMSNLGLELSLRQLDVEFMRSAVGDRHVAALMKSSDAVLGGEQSGHTIISQLQKSGDGLLTALKFIEAQKKSGLDPARMRSELQWIPQRTVNVAVQSKRNLEKWELLQKKISEFHLANGTDSRMVVRNSGTEPLVRIMIESARREIIDRSLSDMAAFIEEGCQ